MPSNVTRFEVLMYLSLGIGIVTAALQSQQVAADWRFGLSIQAVVLAVTIALIWLTARRRQNWARWLFLVLFLIGIPPFTLSIGNALRLNQFLGALKIGQLFLQGVAFYLIFSGNAVAWFRRR